VDRWRIERQHDAARSIAVCEQTSRTLLATRDGRVVTLDVGGAVVSDVGLEEREAVKQLAVSPSGTHLAAAFKGGKVLLFACQEKF